LGVEAKLILCYLQTSPHTMMIGCFRLPIAYAVVDLNLPRETVAKGFDELVRSGELIVGEDSWLLVTRFLEWNPLENPNQGKAAEKLIREIPRNNSIYKRLIDVLRENPRNLPPDFLKGMGTVTETVPIPYRNQEQEQEPEQEPEPEPESAQTARASVDACARELSLDALVRLHHGRRNCPGELHPKLIEAARAAVKWEVSHGRTEAEALTFIFERTRALADVVHESKWSNGVKAISHFFAQQEYRLEPAELIRRWDAELLQSRANAKIKRARQKADRLAFEAEMSAMRRRSVAALGKKSNSKMNTAKPN